MANAKLIGYTRLSETGNALKVNLELEALMEAERYTGKDGREYIPLTIKAERIRDILNKEKEITCVTQYIE